MKQILLFFILSFPLVTYTMENPKISNPTTTPIPSGVSADRFIDYMNAACASANKHITVQFCSYTLLWAIYEGNNKIFDAALDTWNRWKRLSFEDFTRTELACPFVIAASRGYWYAAQKLLERSEGAIINDSCKAHKPNECCAVETSALAIAAKNGHAKVIANLLAYESDTAINPEGAHKNKKTPLMEAIEHDKLACTQALLQGKLKKANPTAPLLDKSFGSILHWALSLKDRSQHVKALLEHGANKDLIRKEKEYQQEGTPLMVAVAYANLEGVQTLLEAKADLTLKHPFSKLTAKELGQMKAGIEQTPVRQNIIRMLAQAEAGHAVTPGV
jgi:hypothetical protein